MHDPLKKFVDEHREEFDQPEAPKFNMALFKERHLVAERSLPKRNLLLMFGNKWLAAACIAVLAGTAFFVFTQKESNPNTTDIAAISPKTESTTPKAITTKITPEKHSEVAAIVVKKTILPKTLTHLKENEANWNEKLLDSSSASNRLAAILFMAQSKNISNADLDQLARTLNQDQNSNVRLAALDVLKKYGDDAHVSALLFNALDVQTDPMVQLALVSLVGKSNNQKVNERLYALANNPETFEAVKDEALSILLEQNKL